ncbi:probable BOI-related E3 ubiquitin-protein ligase 3 [Vigna unguiculata]|uniref:Baculoviral IAP repeat-containing 2/3/4 n=1 Tax=Vigna unguiculata TaxID=3917 RepID=A0A4D6LJI3_VIGUN|nr:probable BOI-related E3 ubiquitin-protein ligase 3 [Vigna unguiculata]QCD88690.1 baculoviral IAP repeat-containing 2/3/4 [Vigna unguiculata]
MAIQTQWYPNNSASSPFWNNGHCAPGFMDSGISFQHKQQQQLAEQHLGELCNGSQGGAFDPNLHVCSSKGMNSPMFAIQFEKQWGEIDQYMKSEDEKLRYMIKEHGKQQVMALLRKLETRTLHVLREKDVEIAQAMKKRLELEEYLKRLEAENNKWQRLAQEKENMALTLYKTLEEMTEGGNFLNNGTVANDAVSCCGETGGTEEREEEEEEETAEKGLECGGVNVDEVEQITRKGGVMVCKSCHSRRSCFLFLPCRHLSSCKVCNASLEACPVCRTPKKATIELRL